jgi:hypothetical protein
MFDEFGPEYNDCARGVIAVMSNSPFRFRLSVLASFKQESLLHTCTQSMMMNFGSPEAQVLGVVVQVNACMAKPTYTATNSSFRSPR